MTRLDFLCPSISNLSLSLLTNVRAKAGRSQRRGPWGPHPEQELTDYQVYSPNCSGGSRSSDDRQSGGFVQCHISPNGCLGSVEYWACRVHENWVSPSGVPSFCNTCSILWWEWAWALRSDPHITTQSLGAVSLNEHDSLSVSCCSTHLIAVLFRISKYTDSHLRQWLTYRKHCAAAIVTYFCRCC